MNNYYFTESKWYGPLPEGILPQYVTPSLFSLIESLPSGPSLIPQFAGMVKEEGKDFVFEYTNVFSLVGKPYTIKTGVPVAEEGKQTFSEEERPEIANASFKKEYGHIETSGEFRNIWVDGYCQALRDFNIGT